MKNPLPVRKALAAALKMLCVLTGAAGFESAIGQPTNCTPPPAGLVAWWRGENNALDSAGASHGTLLGNTAYGSGKVGLGFVFDGDADAVRVGNPASLQLQDLTFECWIKRASSGIVTYYWNGVGVLFAGGNPGGYQFCINNAGTLWMGKLGVDGYTAGPAITDTNWHHVALTKSGTNALLYIDGVGYGVPPYTSTFLFNGYAAIGARGDNLSSSFLGTIDEMSVYNRALSAAEIQAIYNADSEGKCAPPLITAQPQGTVGYWGGTVQFRVGVEGAPQCSYLWHKESFAIPWGTNSTLTLTNLEFADAGSYWVAVTNLYGSTNSASALLVVNPAGVSLGMHPFLTITGTVGKTFGIEYTTEVSETNSWVALTNFTLTQPVQEWIDTSVDAVVTPKRFYHVVPIP